MGALDFRAPVRTDWCRTGRQRMALPASAVLDRCLHGFVRNFVIVSSVIFVFAASQLNHLTLFLSPVALAVVLF